MDIAYTDLDRPIQSRDKVTSKSACVEERRDVEERPERRGREERLKV